MIRKYILLVLVLIGPGFAVFANADPTPDPVTFTLSSEDLALFKKADTLYYNYRRLGLHQLQCQVKADNWEQLKKFLLETRHNPAGPQFLGISIETAWPQIIKQELLDLNAQNDTKLKEKEADFEKWKGEQSAQNKPDDSEMKNKEADLDRFREETESKDQQNNSSIETFEKYMALLDLIKKAGPGIESLDQVQYLLSYTQKKGFQLSDPGFTTTGVPDLDKTVKGALEGTRNEILLFGEFWKSLSSAADLKNQQNFKFTGTADEYRLEIADKGKSAVFFLTKQLLLTRAILTMPPEDGGEVDLNFSFQNTPQGYLMRSLSFTAPKGTIQGKVEVEYGQTGAFLLPKTVKWEGQAPGNDNESVHFGDKLEFSNYQINGSAAGS
jgi:hypothetical protein